MFGLIFCIRLSNFSNTICWKDYSFPIELSWHLCWKSIDHMVFDICVGLFLDSWFCCIGLLVYFMPIPYSITILESLESGKSSNFVLLYESCFDYSIFFLTFLMIVRIALSLSTQKKACWDFTWVCFGSLNQFWENQHPNYINPSNS